jgi:adenine-specific DNA-methyltransferase
MVKQKIIKSPINYMGSKRRLLSQLLPELQQDNIDTFFDLFAGAGNVSLNIKARYHIWNDLSTPLVQMFKDLSTLNTLQFEALKSTSLDLTNKDEFLKLRADYNSGYFEYDFDKSISLYLLIIASFNGLPRFNKAFEYNMPYANSERVNKRYLENKLKILGDFIKVIKNGSYGFTSKSYDKVIKNY